MIEILYADDEGNVFQAIAKTYEDAIEMADMLREKGYYVTIN